MRCIVRIRFIEKSLHARLLSVSLKLLTGDFLRVVLVHKIWNVRTRRYRLAVLWEGTLFCGQLKFLLKLFHDFLPILNIHVVGEECWAFTLKIHPHRLQYRVSIKIFRGQTALVDGHSPQNCKQTVSMCCDARVQSDAQRSTSRRKTLVNYYASISQPARSGYKCRNIRSGMFLFWNWCNIAETRRTLKKIGQRTLIF